MPIILEQPVIREAVPQKTFDGLFVTNLIINCDSFSGNAHVTYCPYNTSTGEILKEQKRTIFIDNFWECVQQVPQAANALNHVLSAIVPIKNWSDSNK